MSVDYKLSGWLKYILGEVGRYGLKTCQNCLFHIRVLSVVIWLIRQSRGFILKSVYCIIIIYHTYVHNIHRRLLKCDLGSRHCYINSVYDCYCKLSIYCIVLCDVYLYYCDMLSCIIL